MRVLSISNGYPPHESGGYEQLAAEVSDGLQRRGHDVQILTSRPPPGGVRVDSSVHYALELDVNWDSRVPGPLQFFLQRRSRERRNAAYLQEVLAEFKPDVTLMWNMYRLQRRLAWIVEQTPDTHGVYYSAGTSPVQPDDYSAYWTDFPQKHRRVPLGNVVSRLALRQIGLENPGVLRMDFVMCVSDYVRRALGFAGVLPLDACVVRNGIALDRFPMRASFNRGSQPLRLLIAGRLIPEKGVHLAVEAMAHLVKRFGAGAPILNIYGQGPEHYTHHLGELIAHYGLAGFVNLHGWVSRDNMPAILQAHDVLLFPVLWNEPLARIVQEAMATGLVVVGTLTGGTDEILRDHHNGLVVPPDDAAALADRITELIQQPDLIEQFAESARRTVEDTFTIDRMLDEVEAVLEQARAQRRLGPPLPPARSRPLFDLKRWVKRPSKSTDYGHARLGDEQHLALAARWLGVAQDVTGNGGLAQLYNTAKREWTAAYPETTGYAIPTLLHYAAQTRDEQLRERVRRMAQFLLSVQLANGAVPIVNNELFKVVQPCAFDVGQIIYGYVAAYHEFNHPDYLEAARRAGDWLIRDQEPDGSWLRFTYNNVVHAWEVRVSWALLLLARVSGVKRYEQAACKNIAWTRSQQHADGWFDHLALVPGEAAVMHTIAYTLEGLLECGAHLNDAAVIEAARRPADVLLNYQRDDGALPGAFADRWRSLDHYTCLTGNSQMAIVWQRLHQLSGEEKYLGASDRLLDYACRSQLVRIRDRNLLGSVPGSYPSDGDYLPDSLPNWAVKFLMDALLLRQAIRRHGRAATPPPR